jgi:Tol biopolymer transport system component
MLPAQIIELDSSKRIVNAGDDLFPSWSKDSRQLIFQNNHSGNFDIFLYELDKDTIITVADTESDEQHPDFIPPGYNEVAYALKTENGYHLYKTDLITKKTSPLFKRDIRGKAPSFTPSGRLVVFNGYDKSSESWQVFSYDFIYDNLNKLTSFKHHEIIRPQLSPDGKVILFGLKDKRYPYNESVVEINWYGEPVATLDSVSSENFCWNNTGFRIICSQNTGLKINQLVSERKDGSYRYFLTSDRYRKATPAVSPDGTMLAVSVKFEEGYDIVIFKLKD